MESINLDAQKTRLRFVKLGLLILFTMVFLLTLFVYVFNTLRKTKHTDVLHPETGYVFPDVKEITSIQLLNTVEESDENPKYFEVSKANWPVLLSSLEPSEYDPSPAKWVAIGVMRIQQRKGPVIEIELFTVRGNIGAFAVEPTSGGERKYYRGGNSESLKKAIRSAYFNSNKS